MPTNARFATKVARRSRRRIDENHLRLKILSGDPRAEEQLVRSFESRLQAMARIRGCAESARDLAQETLVDTIRNLRQGRWNGNGPLAAYVATILRRKISRFRSAERIARSDRSPDSFPAAGPDPLRAAVRSQRYERLRGALERLSIHHRQVLLLFYFHDIGVGEIGRMLGVSRGTVLSRLHYGRRCVARLMRRHRAAPGKRLTVRRVPG